MGEGHIARASETIRAGREAVWNALVDPKAIAEYFFGAQVQSEWREGGPITWKGEYNGRRYEDKGEILRFEPRQALRYSHFSPLAGLPDKPENYHTITIRLSGEGDRTLVELEQDNNPTEEACRHSRENWQKMLAGLRKYVEGRAAP